MVTNFDMKLSASQEAMVRQVGEESVILDLKSDRYMGLDPVGTRMWQVLTAASSVNAGYEVLLGEFDVEPAQLRADVDDFVQQLVQLELVGLEA